MVACLADTSDATLRCVPACQNCGRDLVPDERAAYADRGRNHWRRECGCVVEHRPEPDYGFTDTEIATFERLLIARGCRDDDTAKVLAPLLLNSLAHHGTKVVLGLPEGDVVISAEEAGTLLRRELRHPKPFDPT